MEQKTVEAGDGGGKRNVRLGLGMNIYIFSIRRAGVSELHNSQSGGDEKTS